MSGDPVGGKATPDPFKFIRSFFDLDLWKQIVASLVASLVVLGILFVIHRIGNGAPKGATSFESAPAQTIGASSGFGPQRPTYDWNKVVPGLSCTAAAESFSRCGSANPVFDSFVNTPSYGDEETFNLVAPVVAGQGPLDANFADAEVAIPGRQYWVRILINNDANQNFDCLPRNRNPKTNDCTQVQPGASGIATGTSVRLAVPAGVANSFALTSYISAQNAVPVTIWDASVLRNPDEDIAVKYVGGSAVIYNHAHPNGLSLSDRITSSNGTLVGCNEMDGDVPGTFDCSAYVFVRISVSR